MLQVSAGRRRFLLRVAKGEPVTTVYAAGLTNGQPGAGLTAIYGEVDCGHGWRDLARAAHLDQSSRPKRGTCQSGR